MQTEPTQLELSEHDAIMVMRCQDRRAETGESWTQCVAYVADLLDITTDEVWASVKAAISYNARR